MRCNKKNSLAALSSIAILAMPFSANAQALGVRVGTSTVGISLGSVTTGLTGLGSSLGNVAGGIANTPLASVSLAPITTTGLVSSNIGTLDANVLGGGSVLDADLARTSANVGYGLVTLGTSDIDANVLGNRNIANVSIGGPLTATIGRYDASNPARRFPDQRTTLGPDSFFSNTSVRMNGSSSGGGGAGGPQSNEGASAESSAQVCQRVLRRPGSFSRSAVSQCRRVVASLQVGRR